MGAVVFDLDGTLADTMPGLTGLAVRLLTSNYADHLPDDPKTAAQEAEQMYLNTIGRSFEDQLEEMFPRACNNSCVAEEFHKQKLSAWLKAPLLKDATRVTTLLAIGGAPVFVVSSTEKNLVHQYVMKHRLPVIVTGGKSSSKTEQLCMVDDLISSPHEIVFIGDAPWDGVVAKRVGIKFLGVRHTLPETWFQGEGLESEPDLERVYERLFRPRGGYFR